MKDVATTSVREGVVRSENLRHLRRQSTPNGPSGKAPERQAACGMAWMVALQDESDGVWLARKGQGVHSRGPQMKWFWEAKKGLEPLTLMADVSLAAMAGVTAADHERISEN